MRRGVAHDEAVTRDLEVDVGRHAEDDNGGRSRDLHLASNSHVRRLDLIPTTSADGGSAGETGCAGPTLMPPLPSLGVAAIHQRWSTDR
jgi:hypothetical protein